MFNVVDMRKLFCLKLYARDFVSDKSGVKLLEIVGACFNAYEDHIFGKVNEDYVRRELEWYHTLSRNVNDIPGKIPEIWKKVATPDGFINSNYGWCIWSSDNDEQYAHVLKELRENSESRRAIMIYTRPSMWRDFNRDGMSDFMCTNSVQYLIRNGRLDAIVQMRSNDAWSGYRNDRAWQMHVLKLLAEDLELPIGHLIWMVGSLHVYEQQFYLVDHYNRTGETHITKEEYKKLYCEWA
jgi:Straboviridae dCMP hydroxymethylase